MGSADGGFGAGVVKGSARAGAGGAAGPVGAGADGAREHRRADGFPLASAASSRPTCPTPLAMDLPLDLLFSQGSRNPWSVLGVTEVASSTPAEPNGAGGPLRPRERDRPALGGKAS